MTALSPRIGANCEDLGVIRVTRWYCKPSIETDSYCNRKGADRRETQNPAPRTWKNHTSSFASLLTFCLAWLSETDSRETELLF